MNEIEKQAAYYRPFLIDDRGRTALTIALAAIVAIWFLVYLVGSFDPGPKPQTIQSAAHQPYAVSHLSR